MRKESPIPHSALQVTTHPPLMTTAGGGTPEGQRSPAVNIREPEMCPQAATKCWPLQFHSLPFSLLFALRRMTSGNCASMTPLFPTFLLGLANERPQQEIGEEWSIYSPVPSLPSCLTHLSQSQATAPVRDSPHSCPLIPLPSPSLSHLRARSCKGFQLLLSPERGTIPR